eukprot:2101486-Amphidinium_carterae.1
MSHLSRVAATMLRLYFYGSTQSVTRMQAEGAWTDRVGNELAKGWKPFFCFQDTLDKAKSCAQSFAISMPRISTCNSKYPTKRHPYASLP